MRIIEHSGISLLNTPNYYNSFWKNIHSSTPKLQTLHPLPSTPSTPSTLKSTQQIPLSYYYIISFTIKNDY